MCLQTVSLAMRRLVSLNAAEWSVVLFPIFWVGNQSINYRNLFVKEWDMYCDTYKRRRLNSVFKLLLLRIFKFHYDIFVYSLRFQCVYRLSAWLCVDLSSAFSFAFVVLVTYQLAWCKANAHNLVKCDESRILSQAHTCYLIFFFYSNL